MNFTRTTQTIKQRQRGAVFIVMLVFLIMGITAFLVSSLSNSAIQISRDETTAKALAQAKEALISYAATYGDTHTNNVHGYLPCPDQGQNPTYDGEANSTCGTKDISAVGKLPWKTLGLVPPKDGSGECLWYAVSGTYKNNPKTDLMNWDNSGLFQILSSDGVNILAGSTAESQPVAVIIAPGAPSGSQNHSSATNTPSCGGNYTASNYLDNDTVHTINNAAIPFTANAVTQYISGPVKSASGNIIVNDRMIFITRDDIFGAIKKRNDYAAFVLNLLNTSTACLAAALPEPESMTFSAATPFVSRATSTTSVGSLTIGRVPKSCFATTPLDNWQDNLLYAKCTSGAACLTVNALTCHGVVIFSGEKNGQLRTTDAQKNDWINYIEGAIYTAFFTTGTTTFTGAASYSTASPSTDVLACIL